MPHTIKDVARLAGVSTATVSLVLSERHGARISEATRQRVRVAATELDFQPNIVARSLISGKTQTLGLVVSDIESLGVARMIQGVERAATARHYHVIVCQAAQVDDEMATVRWLRSRGVDGLLLASAVSRKADITGYLEREGIPLVLMNQETDDDTPCYVPDNHLLGRMAADYFLDAGYTRLAYFGPGEARASQMRHDGFIAAAQERGAAVHSCLEPRPLRARDMVPAAESLFAAGCGAECDAALCFNDYMAFGLLQGAQAAGLHVPDNLAIIGVDNTPFAAFPHPALATFRLNMAEIGAQAAEALLGPERAHGVTRVAPILIGRASCGRVSQLPGVGSDPFE